MPIPHSISVKKNMAYNVIGLIVPLFLAILSTPWLISYLGIEQFGLLTLIWSVMGYFGFLDFGISRALTNAVAICRGKEDYAKAWEYIWTAIILLFFISLLLGGVIYYYSAVIVARMHISAELQGRSIACLSWVALALPIVILNGVQKGALEGYERFDLVNKIRLPMALWSYVGPLCLMPFTRNIEHVVIFLIIGRLVTVVLFSATLKGVCVASKMFTTDALRGLLATGGWIGLSSVMSPIMIYIDRFMIAAQVLLSQVAFYTTPMDAITKLLQPVDAIAGVLFPALSKASANDPVRFVYLYRLGVEIINALMFMACITLITFSYPLLALWINHDFASKSALILQILALGVYANAMARCPWGVLQSSGRAAFTAIIQLVEVIPYFVLLWFLSGRYGILGAAIAWTVRVTLDAALLFYRVGNWPVVIYVVESWCVLVLMLMCMLIFHSITLKLMVYLLAVLPYITITVLYRSKAVNVDKISALFIKKRKPSLTAE